MNTSAKHFGLAGGP